MDLTPETIQRLSNWVNDETLCQGCTAYINPELGDNLNTDVFMLYPACFDISRVYFIFP